MATLYEISSNGIKWKFMSRSRYSQAIMREITFINSLLEVVNIQEGVMDSRLWMVDRNNTVDTYTVKSGFDSLCDQGDISFPSEIIWGRHYPYKVNFFLWLLYRERLMTTDKLIRRGMGVDRVCRFCE